MPEPTRSLSHAGSARWQALRARPPRAFCRFVTAYPRSPLIQIEYVLKKGSRMERAAGSISILFFAWMIREIDVLARHFLTIVALLS